MLACSLVNSILVSSSMRPTSASVLATASRPNVTSALFVAVSQAMDDTPRSSSLVENLNSRLRTYFTLRRHLGGAYLDLLRFFLNHRRGLM